MLKISAIISTYNRAEYLDGLFASILSQTIPCDEYEVVIVNNNCTDNTEELCLEFINANPNCKVSYHIESNQGLSYGRNRGIAESVAPIITFLDDDALLSKNFLEKTIKAFDEKPNVNALGGKILLTYLCEVPNWDNPYMNSLLGYFNPGDLEKMFTNDYFRGSNMSFRKQLFDSHEPFNIKLGRKGRNLVGNEEKELFMRLKAAGEEMWYVPSAVVYHLVPQARTQEDFIKRQALGTGKSQRTQGSIKGKMGVLMVFISELLKWGATFILAIKYMFQLKLAVSKMLFKFRYWVTKGIIKG